jgi:hypothetical protein
LVPIAIGGGPIGELEEPLDPQGLPLEGEAQQQRELGDGDTPGEDPPFELPEALVTLREFVWGPGDGHAGVDELLVHFDPQRRPIYIAQDASGDVVAAFDLLGLPARPADADPELPANLFTARRVWQATYDPYGQVLSARIEHPHDPLWTGHKGLFVERLDAGVMDGLPGLPTGAGHGSGLDLPRLTPGSTLLAHARNRWLHTGLGIWTSTDPNASGQGVVGNEAHSGQLLDLTPHLLSLDARHADGGHLMLTYAGDPLSRRDALGLLADMVLPGPGDYITEVLTSLVENYAANQEWDVEWATDWNMDDEWHTRSDNSWIYTAVGEGLYNAFDIDIPFTDEKVNPLDLFAGGYGPGQGPGVANVATKPLQDHHIAARTSRKHAADFERMFGRHRMSMDGEENMVNIPHSGRHNPKYHEYIFKKLQEVENDPDQFKKRLKALKDFVKKNPSFMYDTSGRKPTGWRGMRDMVDWDGKRYRAGGKKKR